MKNRLRYDTVAFATARLRQAGFERDFYLFEDHIVCDQMEFKASELNIIAVYHYEGIIDPADEVTLYGLESESGIRGILISGDGIYSEATSTESLKQLHLKKNQLFQKTSGDMNC